MNNWTLFLARLKNAPKSLAMIGVFLMTTASWWYPLLAAASDGAFGEDAQRWAILTLGILTAFGWAIPQRSIPSASIYENGRTTTDRDN